MSDISVNNQTNNNYQKGVAIGGAIGAAAGGCLNGVGCYLSQKDAIANPDVFIQRAQKEIDECKNLKVSAKNIEKLENALKKSKETIASGKVDFKNVAKKAGCGAAFCAIVGAGIGIVVSVKKKFDEEKANKNINVEA